jgi:hypothetical protein
MGTRIANVASSRFPPPPWNRHRSFLWLAYILAISQEKWVQATTEGT